MDKDISGTVEPVLLTTVLQKIIKNIPTKIDSNYNNIYSLCTKLVIKTGSDLSH